MKTATSSLSVLFLLTREEIEIGQFLIHLSGLASTIKWQCLHLFGQSINYLTQQDRYKR